MMKIKRVEVKAYDWFKQLQITLKNALLAYKLSCRETHGESIFFSYTQKRDTKDCVHQRDQL